MVKKITTVDKERTQTGAIQFDDDWPGLFLRGDDCGSLAVLLNFVMKETKYEGIKKGLKEIIDMICDDVIINQEGANG